MSIIVRYTFEQTRNFIQEVEKQYKKGLVDSLAFEDWKCLAYKNLFEHPAEFGVEPWKIGEPINVAPPAIDMLRTLKEHEQEVLDIELNQPPEKQDYLKTQLYKRILKPTKTFVIKEPITIPGVLDGENVEVPIWFNTTMSGVNVRLGFDNLDSSRPGAIPLSDAPVHMLLGGRTGAGKSVALNDIICSLLLEYPPWELSLILADFKIVELSRYANRIPTPHVKIVAATSSLEFALSTFQYMISEMNARQEVFTACGVNNIAAFRKKFNMCMPRMLLVADEFVQMYENVKEAEQKGNDKADELKKQIDRAISALARLGRSQGAHMLLSSQDMEGVLDEQTAGQFAAGATLAATPSVSNTLIGNGAGATLRGKGKAYVNLRKAEKRMEDNVIVRVPYINGDDPSEEEAAAGKLSYLQDLLKQLYVKSTELGWQNQPYYYNENSAVPRTLFYQSLLECIEYIQNPNEGSELANTLYSKNTFARIPLGREIAYTQDKSYAVDLRYKQFNNLLIHADDSLTKIYITKLVGEALSYYASKFVVLTGDEVLFHQLDIKQFADAQEVKYEADLTGVIPQKYFNIAATRQTLLDLQNYMLSHADSKIWDERTALEFAYKTMPGEGKPDFSSIYSTVEDKLPDLVNMPDEEQIKNIFQSYTGADLDFCERLLGKYVSYRTTVSQYTHDFTEVLGPKSFGPIVLWWIGAEQLKGITEYETRTALKKFLSSSCQVGMFNVLVPSLRCSALSELSQACNIILERCTKEFFLEVDLPRYININKNSYGVHDRELKTNKFLRFYS